MKIALFVITVLSLLSAAVEAATVEMTAGPDLSVKYDSAAWVPFSPTRNPAAGTLRHLTWKLRDAERIQITVASSPERLERGAFKQRLLDSQKFRGDPAELFRKHRESFADRDWSVFEFRNTNTRPPRSEIVYFLPTDDGHARLSVIGDEAKLADHREVIDVFLRNIQVAAPRWVLLTPETIAEHGYHLRCVLADQTGKNGTERTRPSGPVLVHLRFGRLPGTSAKDLEPIKDVSLVWQDNGTVLLGMPLRTEVDPGNRVHLYAKFSARKDVLSKIQLVFDGEGERGRRTFVANLEEFIEER